MCCIWKLRHINSNFRQDRGCIDFTDPWYCLNQLRFFLERDHLPLDFLINLFYLLGEVVDVFQMHFQKEPVMIGQLSVESFLQLIYLGIMQILFRERMQDL